MQKLNHRKGVIENVPITCPTSWDDFNVSKITREVSHARGALQSIKAYKERNNEYMCSRGISP